MRDVQTMMEILRELGVSVERTVEGDIVCEVKDESPSLARYELVRQMRASFCVLGPLLAKRGQAKVSQPGGCTIGVRPVDLHVKGLTALGAHFEREQGYLVGKAQRLTGATMFLGGQFGSTVTGTANVLMAATLAEGRTEIENAACEPEVEDLARFLVQMGAHIQGAGSHRIVVDGVNSLRGTEYRVMPDRIEAGSFLLSAAMTHGEMTVEGCRPEHLGAVVDKLEEAGIPIFPNGDSITVKPLRSGARPKPIQVTTLPYPGFPTDLQAQLMALLANADGISVVTERIYPDRFMHVAELNRMGAEIRKDGPTAIIHGVPTLSGASVMASDLRASAALVLAALAAEGKTEVLRVYHIDRGYYRIEEKLNGLGAKIERQKDGKAAELPGEIF